MHYVTHAITLQSKTKNNSFYQYKKGFVKQTRERKDGNETKGLNVSITIREDQASDNLLMKETH